jgi:hypothetical protein
VAPISIYKSRSLSGDPLEDGRTSGLLVAMVGLVSVLGPRIIIEGACKDLRLKASAGLVMRSLR